jgi:hypothetical protein
MADTAGTNLYEVLELLLENASIADPERDRCLDIINQLRDLNALGSTIGVTGGLIHNYEPGFQGPWNSDPILKCTYCGKTKKGPL